MKSIAIILISLFSLKSCLTDGTTIHVVMDDAKGLEAGTKVTCKGLEVGKIKDIKFASGNVVADVELKEDFNPGKGATAEIQIADFFGRKHLVIIPSGSNLGLVSGDTIYAKSSADINNVMDLLKDKINIKDLDQLDKINLDSLNINLDSLGVNTEKILKEAEKIFKLKDLVK